MGGSPGVTIGQTCISVNLAAGFPINELNYQENAWIVFINQLLNRMFP
jgi:hypothetical protein